MTRNKRYIAVFAVLLLAAATAVCFAYYNYDPYEDVPMPEDEIIIWSDKAVERQVREKTGKEQGDIWLSDLWDVYRMNLEGEEVHSVEDLGILLNLRSLYLVNTSVTDLSPITGLETLEIEGGVSEILDSVGQLKSLTRLSLRGLQVDSLDHLKGLRHLRSIYLKDMPVQDIQAVKHLKNLSRFSAQNTLIHDISPFKKLRKLEYLEICSSEVTEIPNFINAIGLKEIRMPNNKINKIVRLPYYLVSLEMPYNHLKSDESLKNVWNLQTLDLAHNELEEITEISSLERLVELNLLYNNLTEIELNPSRDLRILRFTVSELEDFDFLNRHRGLELLDLSGTDLSRIKTFLPSLSEYLVEGRAIDEIVVDNCQLTNLDIFSSSPHLRTLSVQHNNLQDLNAVNQMRGLIRLDVSHNDIGALSFPPNESIRMVVAENCNINDLSLLSPLRNLITLDVSENNIQEIAEYIEFINLRDLDISNNPIPESAVAGKFPKARLETMKSN